MSLDAQVKDPDHNYQGMTDPKNCPAFVNDFDCRSSDIDPKYHVLQQKVQHHPPMMCCLDLSSCHQQLVLDAPAAVFCRDEGPKPPFLLRQKEALSLATGCRCSLQTWHSCCAGIQKGVSATQLRPARNEWHTLCAVPQGNSACPRLACKCKWCAPSLCGVQAFAPAMTHPAQRGNSQRANCSGPIAK